MSDNPPLDETQAAIQEPPTQEAPPRDPLFEFSCQYFSNCSAIPIPPFKDGVVRVGAFTGITLYRNGPFQVQLWTCDPNSNIPEHSHPGVDVIQVYLWGQIHLTHNGVPVIEEAGMAEFQADGIGYSTSMAYGLNLRVHPGQTHGAKIGPMGGAFLTIQMWLDGEPRSVDTAWEGDHLSADHTARIKEFTDGVKQLSA